MECSQKVVGMHSLTQNLLLWIQGPTSCTVPHRRRRRPQTRHLTGGARHPGFCNRTHHWDMQKYLKRASDGGLFLSRVARCTSARESWHQPEVTL